MHYDVDGPGSTEVMRKRSERTERHKVHYDKELSSTLENTLARVRKHRAPTGELRRVNPDVRENQQHGQKAPSAKRYMKTPCTGCGLRRSR